jgi:dolichyl-diphosphooligosaccharide---protein glycosyltransferase
MIVSLSLVSIFVIALFMRSFPAKYGFYLNEFDPYYDYKSALYIVTSFDASWKAGQGGFPGLLKYFSWTDYTTWFPEGRAVAPTSQDGLQFAGALSYLIARDLFGLQICNAPGSCPTGTSLYNFLVLFPVFIGSLTSIVFYFLVKRIAGDVGGLFAALMVAVSPPLIERGNLGWFKSEPLGIFLFAIGAYFFLTMLDSDMSSKQRVGRGLLAGFLLGYANTAWGGSEYFTAAFGLFFVILPFMKVDLSKLTISALFFTIADIFGSALFPRPGVAVVTSAEGLAIIGGTAFIVTARWVQTWAKPDDFRNTLLKILLGFGLGMVALISFGSVSTLSTRYLSVLFPWIRSTNPLVQSVAEEALPTGSDYFSSYLLLLLLGIFGAIIAFRRRNPATIFALVIGITMIYASDAFSRLLVYSSIAFVILAAIGFSELAFSLVKPNTSSQIKRKQTYSAGGNEMRTIYSVAFIALLAIPASIYWIPNPVQCTTSSIFCDQSPADYGVSIANGGTIFAHSELSDWLQSLKWISQNTPQNAVIIAWWDYGYWINVMGNRTVVADNATLNQTRIAEIGQMFMSNATEADKLAMSMSQGRPTYILTFLTGSLIPTELLPGVSQNSNSTVLQTSDYYSLQIPAGSGFTAGGGDESKKQWFIAIAGLNTSEYIEPAPDGFNLTPYALQSTLFGQMLPFTLAGFWNIATGTIHDTWGVDSNGNPPLQLFNSPSTFQLTTATNPYFQEVYASPSLAQPITCGGDSSYPIDCFTTVLLYKVNA